MEQISNSSKFKNLFPYFSEKYNPISNRIFISIFVFLLISAFSNTFACTNLIVTKGASADGSVMITYAADSHTRYGTLGFFPAVDHKPGKVEMWMVR